MIDPSPSTGHLSLHNGHLRDNHHLELMGVHTRTYIWHLTFWASSCIILSFEPACSNLGTYRDIVLVTHDFEQYIYIYIWFLVEIVWFLVLYYVLFYIMWWMDGYTFIWFMWSYDVSHMLMPCAYIWFLYGFIYFDVIMDA